MFAGDPAPFVMELPAYHMPTVETYFEACGRGWSFIKKSRNNYYIVNNPALVLNELWLGRGFIWNA